MSSIVYFYKSFSIRNSSISYTYFSQFLPFSVLYENSDTNSYAESYSLIKIKNYLFTQMTQRNVEFYFNLTPFFFKFICILHKVFLKLFLFFQPEIFKSNSKLSKCRVVLTQNQINTPFNLMQIPNFKYFAIFLSKALLNLV